MRILTKTAAALGLIGAMAVGTTVPVLAQGIYFNAPGVHIGIGHPYHRHYYGYYDHPYGYYDHPYYHRHYYEHYGYGYR